MIRRFFPGAIVGLPPFEPFVDALDGALFFSEGSTQCVSGNGDAGDFAFAGADFAGKWIDFADGFDLAARSRRGRRDRDRADRVRSCRHERGRCLDGDIRRARTGFRRAAGNRFARDGIAFFEHEHHAVVRLGRADAVDAGDGGDDDDVAALEERASGAHAELIELIVDGGFFFDVGVARRDVGFGLVVVVVADEIFDGVRREE